MRTLILIALALMISGQARASGAQHPPAPPSTREQRMAEALERARAQGVGQ